MPESSAFCNVNTQRPQYDYYSCIKKVMKICSDPEFYYVERKKWALKMQMRQESERTRRVKFSSINFAQFSNYNRFKFVVVGHGMGRKMFETILWLKHSNSTQLMDNPTYLWLIVNNFVVSGSSLHFETCLK